MRLRTRGRLVRTTLALTFVAALMAPAAGPVAAVDDSLILRVGTDQEFSGPNPWQIYYVLDYEVMTLNYDLLVGYDENLEFTEGFATSWSTSTDGLTTTFKIRPGMLWSDGEPATAEDARFTYQLAIDALDQGVAMGNTYLESYLSSAGIKAVSAPDAETLVVETETPTALLLPAYVPILPKHVWEGYTLDQIGNSAAPGYFANNPPVVGTGPYVATAYVPGQSMTFSRNPNYWGKQGAAEQIIITHFENNSTMTEALRNGEIDYARGISADAFDSLAGQPNIVTVEGFANGYSYLTFNGYGQPIPGGGSSTTATADPAFRDALGYAVDLPLLVDRVLAGHGEPGTSLLPPFHANWYVPPEPDVLRTFNLDTAREKLEAAGYRLDGSGQRLDKEGKPIVLGMTWPASEEELASVAQFVTEWWGELGITVNAGVTEDDTLTVDITSPEYDPPGIAKFDTYMWGWGGDVDPSSLLAPFTTDEIGGSSDTFYSNPEFDELFVDQGQELDESERKAMIQRMQELFYRDLPNIPLYYDTELHAYRTDRFTGWQNQPLEGGTPLFQFGPIGYNMLTVAGAEPSPTTEPGSGSPGASASPAASGSGSPTSSGGDNTMLLLGVGALVAVIVVAGGVMFTRRRGESAEEE